MEQEVERNKRIFKKKLEEVKGNNIQKVFTSSDGQDGHVRGQFIDSLDFPNDKNISYYKEQIQHLQFELNKVRDQLIESKAKNAVSNESKEITNAQSNDNNNDKQEQLDHNELVENEVVRRISREKQTFENNLIKLEFEFEKKLESHRNEWSSEKNKLLNQIRDAEALTKSLRIELSNANNQLLVPKTPQMEQFMVLLSI